MTRWAEVDGAPMREWSVVYGTDQDDLATDMALTPDGHVFLAGHAFGEFPGFARRGPSDLFLLRVPVPE